MARHDWWDSVETSTRRWLLDHHGERISWHLVEELRHSGAPLEQPDPASTFVLPDAEWARIGSRSTVQSNEPD